MPLNRACIGRHYPPMTAKVTLEAIQNYARAYNDENPRFFNCPEIVAPPMYAVAATWGSLLQATTDPSVNIDPLRLLHSAQDMEFLGPIRPGDLITSYSTIISIEPKPTGEEMLVRIDAHNQHDQPVLKALFTAFVRGGRNRKVPITPREPEPDRGEPLFSVAQQTEPDQTVRYAEASGDRNPIHLDENIAKMAGLPGIIVHGLCTMAFVSRIVIDRLCKGEPLRLVRLRARFSRPLLPGLTITTSFWPGDDSPGRDVYTFETVNPRGQAVIRGGIAEVAA